jgi:hypothetical protein
LHKARTTAPAEVVATTIKSRDESPGTTRLALDLGAANLTLGSLRIDTNEPVFTRAVILAVPEVADDGIRERNIAEAVIYRVNVNSKKRSASGDSTRIANPNPRTTRVGSKRR